MRALLITAEVRAEIARIVAHAATYPIDAESIIRRAATDPDGVQQFMGEYTMDIPMGFRVTFSHEHQPPGLCRHISISVDTPNVTPNPEAVYMLCEEFGMGDIKAMAERRELSTVARTWVELMPSGRKAVNIVQLITTPPAAA